MRNMKQVKWVVAILMIAVLPWGVTLAQETASSINGTIVDSNGNAISGATVIVTHEPTGQVKTLTTNDDGRYSARGLRTGGPYNIEVRNSGYSDAEEGNIFIKLGEDRAINAVLVADAISLDTVTAVGVAAQSATFNPDNMGAGSSFSQEQITNLPATDRDVRDFIRLDSRVNLRDFESGISVSGVNNRFNNFSVDGVGASDPFGLEPGGFTGLSQPFSLDTIAELNVQLSPYDVTLSNFTGASINAVTKSGTNEFSGRISLYYGDESLARTDDDFSNEVYSISLGGPIIKDKLFFFVSYENEERTRLANELTLSQSGLDDLVRIQNIASSVWNFDAGTFRAPANQIAEEESLLVKLDWNINDFHRASLRYTTNEDLDPSFPNYGGTNSSFSSHWFNDDFENDTLALNVYSDWTPKFSTEFRYSQNTFDKQPFSQNGTRLPQIEIRGIGEENARTRLGTERFRHANVLNVEEERIYLEGNYFLGNHNLTFGVERKSQDNDNLFVFASLGQYTFNNVDDFEAGFYDFYQLRIGSDPANPFPVSKWSWKQDGFFIQDNWTVNDRLTLQYGFRYDKPSADSRPRFNQSFQDAFGFANNSVIDEGEFQPRLGFNYDMSDELYMQLRGGIGIFTGQTPNVWLSNSFTNTGGDVAVFRDFDSLGFSPDPNNQPRPGGDGAATQDVDSLDPNFELPTVLKSNIAVDAELPWFGLIGSLEFEYSKVQNAIHYQHLNLGERTGTLDILGGRNSYYSDPLDPNSDERANQNDDFNDVLFLTNTDKGETKRATISLELPQTEHWYAKASYTYTDATEVSAGTSSRAISNWNNTPAINPNEAILGTSAYEIENAFNFFVNYENNFFGDTYTKFGLIFISRDGEPFSYNYSNDVNGDGIRDNDLFYVPNPGEYVLVNGDDPAAFETFLSESGLDQYRGQIAPRNAFKPNRVNQWDLNVQQELPTWGRVRATMYFNIKNLGNLLNSDWGQVQLGSFDGVNIADFEGVDDQGRAILDWNGRNVDGNLFTSRFNSQWRAQVGFRLDW